MIPASARLEGDGLVTYELRPENGVYVANLNIGFPAVRGVNDLRPDADGEIDQTRFFGACAVTLSGTLAFVDDADRQAILDRLKTFLRPDLRPYLVYQLEPDGDERRVLLRPDQFGAPITVPGSTKFTVGWRGPNGISEANEETVTTLDPSHADETGRSYDLDPDRHYPDTDTPGLGDADNLGNANAYPVLRLSGPAIGPRIENRTVGLRLVFPDVELAAGDYLEVDTRTKTVRLNSDPTQSRYPRDFVTSAWWALVPGVNVLRYFPEAFGEGSIAEVVFRSAWL